MKLSAVTILSLICTLEAAVQILTVHYDEVNDRLNFDMQDITEEQCNSTIKSLKEKNAICIDYPFKASMKDLLNEIEDRDHLVHILARYYGGLYHQNPPAGQENPLRQMEIANMLNEEQFNELVPRYGGQIHSLLPYMAIKRKNGVFFASDDFNPAIVRHVNKQELISLIHLTKEGVLKENAEVFRDRMADAAINLGLHEIKPSAAKAFLETEEFCSQINTWIVQTTPSYIVSMLTPECANEAEGNFSGIEFKKNIRSLPDVLIEHGVVLHEDAFNNMTTEQIGKYHSRRNADEDDDSVLCDAFIMPTLIGNLGKMRPDCFAGYLKSLGETVFFNRTNFYGRLPVDILSGLEGEEVAKIAAVSWPSFSTAQLQHVVEKEEVCKHLPDGALDLHGRGVKISNGCFHELSNRNKGMALYHCSLSDDVLATVSGEDFKEYVLHLDGVEYTGKEIFTKTMFSPNIVNIVKNMSSKIDQEQHICHLFNNEHTELKKYHVINLHASQQCVDCFKENINLNELNNLTLHMRKMLDLPDMVEKAGDEVYKYDRKQFNAVAMAHGDVCASMTKEIFVEMSEETRNGLKPECVASLKFLGEVEGKIIKSMSPKSFGLLTSEQYNAIKDKLTTAQAKAVPASAKAAPAETAADAAAPAEAAPPAK